jgi:hypothetical protein
MGDAVDRNRGKLQGGEDIVMWTLCRLTVSISVEKYKFNCVHFYKSRIRCTTAVGWRFLMNVCECYPMREHNYALSKKNAILMHVTLTHASNQESSKAPDATLNTIHAQRTRLEKKIPLSIHMARQKSDENTTLLLHLLIFFLPSQSQSQSQSQKS